MSKRSIATVRLPERGFTKEQLKEIGSTGLIKVMEDKRLWGLIVFYTLVEMAGKRMITNYFKKQGIKGMDDWIDGLTCTSLVKRLYKLKLIDKSIYTAMLHIVEVRNDLVHDFTELLFIPIEGNKIDQAEKAVKKVMPIVIKALEIDDEDAKELNK